MPRLSQPLLVIQDQHFLQHDTGPDHPEGSWRLTAIAQRLRTGLLADRVAIFPSRSARRQELTAIHDENYLLRFEEAALTGRSYLDHPDNQICYDSYQAALLAAGAGPAAIDLLEARQGCAAFAAVRPPGHHAERAMALGFCFFNNAAVAARYWQNRYQRRRLMIIDWDAHHGNGIQAAFEEDPEVFYLSIHEHPTWSFPGTGWGEERGSGSGRGTTLNLPLPPGSDDAAVLRLVSEKVEPALAQFQPQALIIGAGFDGHRDDDMSGLAYSSQLYGRLGRLAASWAGRYCPGRLLTLLEGGYRPDILPLTVENYLAGLLAEQPPTTDSQTDSNQQREMP
ncbi:MAG TPA: histone deacetylase [Desulfurivibrio alkaliphilus]|uniref:Histone deacetylase n=1 Tax=Desulfurivibrio alkaliphilus TaxID=427923 RepID=A0A7C2TM98_9BACT|nr:histone deacetylase [Desulfurivibrio alkaliphilus]